MTDCKKDMCEKGGDFMGRGARTKEAIAAAEAAIASESNELPLDQLQTLVDEAKVMEIVRDAADGNILADGDDE